MSSWFRWNLKFYSSLGTFESWVNVSYLWNRLVPKALLVREFILYNWSFVTSKMFYLVVSRILEGGPRSLLCSCRVYNSLSYLAIFSWILLILSRRPSSSKYPDCLSKCAAYYSKSLLGRGSLNGGTIWDCWWFSGISSEASSYEITSPRSWFIICSILSSTSSKWSSSGFWID